MYAVWVYDDDFLWKRNCLFDCEIYTEQALLKKLGYFIFGFKPTLYLEASQFMVSWGHYISKYKNRSTFLVDHILSIISCAKKGWVDLRCNKNLHYHVYIWATRCEAVCDNLRRTKIIDVSISIMINTVIAGSYLPLRCWTCVAICQFIPSFSTQYVCSSWTGQLTKTNNK